MTADNLQEIVRRLSNTAYCRYWLKWPDGDGSQKMAVSLIHIDDNDKAHYLECAELEEMGFAKETYCGGPLYVIHRTQ